MKLTKFGRVPMLILVATVLLVLGCSDDSTQPEPKAATPRYPETTTPDIVISNLLKSYEDRNIEQYGKLLHNEYIRYNEPGEIPGWYERSVDMDITGNMFLAALHQHPDSTKWLDKLDLAIYTGTWGQIPRIDGADCSDCWQTERDYHLEFVMSGGTTVISNGLMMFMVKSVEVNGTKIYRIIRRYDLTEP
jgi:hypothetical protein